MSLSASRIRMLTANLGILAVGEILTKFFTLLAFVMLARNYEMAAYGDLEYALAVIFVLTLVVDFGLGMYGAREIAKRPDQVPSIVRRVVTTRAWLVLFSLIILVGVAFLTPTNGTAATQAREARTLLLLLGISLLPAPLLMQWVFQGLDLTHFMSIAQLLRYSTFAAAVFAIIRLNAPITYVAGAEMLGVLAAAGFMLFAYYRRYGDIRVFEPSLPDWHLLCDAFPLGLSTLMWAIKYVFMTVLLKMFLVDSEDIGRFGAALRIIIAAHTFIALYLYNLLPTVARCSTEPPAALRSLLGGAVKLGAWAALFMCATGIAAADRMINVMYHGKYKGSAGIFQILILMLGAALISSHFRVTLIAYGKQKLELISTGIGAMISIDLLWILNKHYGLRGAATAMVLGEVATLVLSYFLVEWYVMPTRVWRSLLAPAAVAVVLLLTGLALKGQSDWMRIGSAVGIVIAGLALLDRNMIKGVSAVLSPPRLVNPEASN